MNQSIYILQEFILGFRDSLDSRDINIEDTTPPYVVKETTKKSKPKTLNSDQKRIQNQI